MDRQDRKKRINAYKTRKVTGGVFAIVNTAEDKRLLGATTDLQGSKNRFAFSQSTDSCFDLKLRPDWNRLGKSAFAFEVLETLDKKETQSLPQFQDDIKALLEITRERLAGTALY
jgi:2-phospho-L-lactate transferase/gluconeogenesis factor (CofD/UPF0052 family)